MSINSYQGAHEMRKVFILILCMFNLLFASNSIPVGNKHLYLDAPEGFVAIKGKYEEVDNIVKYFVMPNFKLLELYVTRKDAESLLGNSSEEFKFNNYIMIQTSENQNENISKKKFKYITQILRQKHRMVNKNQKKINQILHSIAHDLSNDYGAELKLKSDEIIPLDIFMDNDNSFSANYLISINNNSIICSSNILLIKGKIISVYAYQKYNSNQDISSVRSTSKNFIFNILNNNAD